VRQTAVFYPHAKLLDERDDAKESGIGPDDHHETKLLSKQWDHQQQGYPSPGGQRVAKSKSREALIRAAGLYYQRIYDLSSSNLPGRLHAIREYYDFPYKVHPSLKDVAVVGAGTGNDVAAALRAGAARVDAIEIDPAIMAVGRANHPERPYSDARAHVINNDARSFLRTTHRKYDLFVYGLLDSHTLLSQGSSVRLDSFVYTVEGLTEARNRLKSTGVLSLSFSMLSPGIGRKIYLMLQQVFDGRPPVAVKAYYDGSVIFLESNDTKCQL
jgi:hypothetical protein